MVLGARAQLVFKIRGERHSGTNLIEALINLNLQHRVLNPTPNVGESANARVSLSHKHMFFAPSQEDAMLAALSQVPVLLLIVREPVRWLVAMHRHPHHSE